MANEDQKTAERIQLAAVSPSAGVTRRLKKISGVEGGMAESMSRFDWFVVNTGSGTCTIGANGNTTVGTLTVANGASGWFRIRRTAANTFTVYRLN